VGVLHRHADVAMAGQLTGFDKGCTVTQQLGDVGVPPHRVEVGFAVGTRARGICQCESVRVRISPMANSHLQPPPISPEQPFWKRRWVVLVATVLLTAVVGSFTNEIVSRLLDSGGDQSKPTVTQNEAVAPQQEKDRQTKVAAEKAAAAEKATWIDLFDGADLSAWTVDPDTSKAFTVNNGVLAVSGVPSGVLWTKDEFRDFELSLEYRFPPGRTTLPRGSGVIVRTDRDEPYHDLVEVQLNTSTVGDDASGSIWLGREARLDTGSRSARFPLNRPREAGAIDRPIGQWNNMTIRCDGPNIVVILNDAIVISGRNANQYAAPVGLRSQGTAIEFRNIRVRELSTAENKT